MYWYDKLPVDEKLKIQKSLDHNYIRLEAKPENRMAECELKRLLKMPRKRPTYRR